MFEVIKFFLKCIGQLLTMLFEIDIGNGLSLGLLMAIIFIFLPLMLSFINLLKVNLKKEDD